MINSTFIKHILLSITTSTLMVANAANVPEKSDSSFMKRGVVLQEVETVAKRNDFGYKSAQMSAISIEPEQINIVPVVFGEPDVLKALQKLPGVQVANEGMSGILVRGGDYDQNLIMLDRATMFHTEHLRGYVSAINPHIIEYVDFYRGAFPARYGSRISSVVDVGISPGDFNKYHGSLNIGTLTSSLQVEGPIFKGKTSFNVAGRISYLDLIAMPVLKKVYDRPTDLQPYSKMKFFDINAKIAHRFAPDNTLSVMVYYGKDSDGISPSKSEITSETIDRSDSDLPIEERVQYITDNIASSNDNEFENLLASLEWSKRINNKLSISTNVSYSSYKSMLDEYYYSHYLKETTVRLLQERITEAGKTNRSDISEISLSGNLAYKLPGNGVLRAGAGYSLSTLYPESENYYSADYTAYVKLLGTYENTKSYNGSKYGEQNHINNAFLYVENDYTLATNLRWNIGLRYALYSTPGKVYHSLEPRVSLRYLLTDKMSFKASYSRMSQAIHRLSSSTIVSPSDIWIPSTSRLPVVKGNQYAVGYNYEIIPNDLSISVEAYYKTISNLVEYQNGASYLTTSNWEGLVAVGNGRSYGVELYAEKRMGNTTGWISYTWSKSLRKFDREGMQLNGGHEYYAGNDRRHNFSATLSHKFKISNNKSLEVYGSWSYQSGRRGNIGLYQIYSGMINEEISKGSGVEFPYGSFPTYLLGELQYGKFDWTDKIHFYRIYQMFTLKTMNDFKLPDSHHLDVGANFSISHKYGESIIGLSVYNVYNRYNVGSAYMGYDKDQLVLKGICPFPIIPSISYTHKF